MLYCVKCGCCSGELGKGWVAMRCDDPDPDVHRPRADNRCLLSALRGRRVRLPTRRRGQLCLCLGTTPRTKT